MLTVKEIRESLNSMVKVNPDIDNWTFEVILNEPSIGARASVTVDSVYQGFDWEYGKVLATPNKPIVRESK